MHLRARVIDEDEATVPVERDGAAAEQVVQSHHQRLQAMGRTETVDTISVLFSEKQLPRFRIHGEASKHRLPGLVGERNHYTRRPAGVDGKRRTAVEAVDLPGGVSAPPLAQHHESAMAIEGELNG